MHDHYAGVSSAVHHRTTRRTIVAFVQSVAASPACNEDNVHNCHLLSSQAKEEHPSKHIAAAAATPQKFSVSM
jgi:hypothetical protein